MRLSIVEEIAQAFALHMASVTSLQQAFFNRTDDEIYDFDSNCPPDIRTAIESLGFAIPQSVQTGTVATTETQQQIAAWQELTQESSDISKLFGV